ncbi:MAG: aminotransferase class V-fold PLP-dependent enzyme [Calditrichaceae bacterium]|nr:aminotransferase class V-fold PLP-dependent enzyme [Calditrichaceae bacterium]
MMNPYDFRKHAHQVVDWIADYFENIEKFPVKSQVQPKEVYNRLPDSAPEQGESMDKIMQDFQNIILPGITHWQSPNFFAYFPANSSYPSVLAEMLTAALGAQCMIWETSPAAAELEEKVMNWLKQMLSLPISWYGVIQDTASSSTLCALITAREIYTNFAVNKSGFTGNEKFRIYGSSETHSSIDKGVKIAGFGLDNLVKIQVDENQAMRPDALRAAIESDISKGFKPLCVVATLGTTGTTGIDPLKVIAEICQKYKIWLHVDAALAGSALILPEYRWMAEGLDMADSFVFNPHKWLFTNFDCSAYFVKDKDALINTFTILPEYLKTKTTGKVNDYRDWGIALGRRFRALKLWFVIRDFGVQGLQERLRYHIQLAEELERKMKEHPEFELMTRRNINLVCFRYHPKNIGAEYELDQLNESILHKLNATGKIYLTHTRIKNHYVIRLIIGQTYVTREHVEKAWQLICSTIKNIR